MSGQLEKWLIKRLIEAVAGNALPVTRDRMITQHAGAA
jgi:hypothetical protein